MKIKIFDENGEIVDTNDLSIKNSEHGDILNIYGFAEYYIRSLLQMWEERHSAIILIDAGKGWYVFVKPLKDFLIKNGIDVNPLKYGTS